MNAVTNPDFYATSKQDAEAAHERLKINALVQLELLRDQMFFDAIEPTTSFKEKLAYAEHLVKSTPIESEMKKSEGPGNAFQFAFQFQSPTGEVQTVGAIIETPPQIPELPPEPSVNAGVSLHNLFSVEIEVDE